jgi:Tfp pilus assembly protein PilZ
MQEKRKTTRIEAFLTLRYSPEISSKDSWNIALIRNISESGVLFDTIKQFQVGENLFLKLKIPLDPDNWMETKGSVVESFPYMGKFFLTRLKFTDFTDAQKSLIKNYVAWFLSKNQSKSMEPGNDKREEKRVYKNLILSYGIQNHLGVVEKWDITTVKNFSRTGMVFTSSHACEDKIDFMIKLPTHPYEYLRIRGIVIESSALKLANSETATGTFLTRIKFIDVKDEQDKLLSDYVEWVIKNCSDKPKKEDA